MTYLRFLARRLLQAIPVVIGGTIIVFFLIHLVPGDPARTALGVHATPRAVAALRHEWGLDRPLFTQYLLFMQHLVTGNFGESLRYKQPAGNLVFERLSVTIWLLVYATVLTIVLSVPMALIAASKPGALRDRLVSMLAVISLGIPGFWLGLILIE